MQPQHVRARQRHPGKPARLQPAGYRPHPDAVELSGTDDAAEAKADLAWREVTDESVTELELRGTVGPDYDAEDESIIATFSPADSRTWTGDFGLLLPGSAASFKLYAKTGRQRTREQRGDHHPPALMRPARLSRPHHNRPPRIRHDTI